VTTVAETNLTRMAVAFILNPVPLKDMVSQESLVQIG
jgi:hypothetical protein